MLTLAVVWMVEPLNCCVPWYHKDQAFFLMCLLMRHGIGYGKYGVLFLQ